MVWLSVLSARQKYDYTKKKILSGCKQHSISIVIKNDMQPLYYTKDTVK